MKLLTYTPRAERTRAPICDDLSNDNNDPIYPAAWWVHDVRDSDFAVKGDEPLVPYLAYCDAPDWAYIDHGINHLEWETGICFIDRAGYYAAHRIARLIRRGNGIAILDPAEFQGVQLEIEVGERHVVTWSDAPGNFRLKQVIEATRMHCRQRLAA